MLFLQFSPLWMKSTHRWYLAKIGLGHRVHITEDISFLVRCHIILTKLKIFVFQDETIPKRGFLFRQMSTRITTEVCFYPCGLFFAKRWKIFGHCLTCMEYSNQIWTLLENLHGNNIWNDKKTAWNYRKNWPVLALDK